jgi:hypothetical protein
MRKVFVKIYAEAVLTMDEGVELSELMNEARLVLEHPLVYDKVDVQQLDIVNHEVTDSK